MSWVFLNGQFLLEREASIPITDRAFLFGDGVFTTIRLYDGQLECWQDHVKRLEEHCQQLNLLCPSLELEWIKELVYRNQAFKGLWRLKVLITGGSSTQLTLPQRQGQLLITLKPVSFQTTSCRLCLYPYSIEGPLSGIKSLAYLQRLMVADYAAQRGYDDALVLSNNKQPVEASFSNLIWFYQGNLWMPPSSLPYFSGLFLNAIIKKLPYVIYDFEGTLEDIPSEAHLYLANSLYHLRPIIEIERRRWGQNSNLNSQLKEQINSCVGNAGLQLLLE